MQEMTAHRPLKGLAEPLHSATSVLHTGVLGWASTAAASSSSGASTAHMRAKGRVSGHGCHYLQGRQSSTESQLAPPPKT